MEPMEIKDAVFHVLNLAQQNNLLIKNEKTNRYSMSETERKKWITKKKDALKAIRPTMVKKILS